MQIAEIMGKVLVVSTAPCEGDTFFCHSNMCINHTLVCNGIQNCVYPWDENHCKGTGPGPGVRGRSCTAANRLSLLCPHEQRGGSTASWRHWTTPTSPSSESPVAWCSSCSSSPSSSSSNSLARSTSSAGSNAASA